MPASRWSRRSTNSPTRRKSSRAFRSRRPKASAFSRSPARSARSRTTSASSIGFDVPPLSPQSRRDHAQAPAGVRHPHNPLDLTTQPIWEPDLVGYRRQDAARRSGDRQPGDLDHGRRAGAVGPLHQGPDRGAQGQQEAGGVLDPGRPLAARAGIPGACARAPHHPVALVGAQPARDGAGDRLRQASGGRASQGSAATPFADLPQLGAGPQPEWLGKKVLAAAGIAIPAGALARSVDEAAEIARRIGYPVVAEGAGRDAGAQDRSRRRAAQHRRRGGAAARPGRR